MADAVMPTSTGLCGAIDICVFFDAGFLWRASRTKLSIYHSIPAGVYRRVISSGLYERGVKIIGATAHYVNDNVKSG